MNLILFDEVEDVFPSRGFSFFGMEMKSGENKGWINKALEENKTPAIWICNRISQIDSAFLRRFDYAMELNTPPRSVRLNIVRSRLTDTPVSESFMQRLSEHEELSPAQVAQAAKVLQRMACADQNAAEAVLEKVLVNSAKAMGQKPLGRKQTHATHYSLDYLNANVDLPRLVEGLKRSKRGNLCFYGAPGTGKTALAGYIAKQLDKPLLSKRASDILGMYVGQSEQNIARMFEQARQEDAVLVLDEADSLLRDRRGAKQSWEVSQVNELLVQMENFDGLFICSTNLMDDLDQASLRRFAIKVEFDYLTADQAVNMLRQESTSPPTPADVRAVAMLSNLAPGDFAAVKKRLDILGLEAEPNVVIKELKLEVLVKHDGAKSHAIGFLI
ncbi:MAG: ATP-binding protein [Mariprofundaceae bacterium]|nr:ATP-binding protein [Mariprofundaceae bacterium]